MGKFRWLVGCLAYAMDENKPDLAHAHTPNAAVSRATIVPFVSLRA